MRLALLTLVAGVALAQVGFDFQWQPGSARVPGLAEFRAIVKNDSSVEIRVYGLDVLTVASHPPPNATWKSIPWVGTVGVREAIDRANQHGFWYYGGLVCEAGGALGSITLTGKLAEIREKIAVVFPLAGGICTVGRAIWVREHPKLAMPDDLLPGIFYVPAGGRADYALFAAGG